MANKLSNIQISEVSFCKKGMNQHAKISLFKSVDPLKVEVNKYYSEYSPPDSAMDFKSILEANRKQKRLYDAREELYPLFNALTASVSSITTDTSISDSERQVKIDDSVNNFLSAVKLAIPDVEEELQKMFEDLNAGILSGANPDGEKMSEEVNKKLAEVEKALAEKTEALVKAEKTVDELKAAAEKKKKEAEVAKSDEVLVVGEQKISKAAVGDEQFAVFKAMNERVAKAEEAAEFARLEKRASDEFAHLPGTDAEKARVLKAVSALSEDSAKYVESILKSVEEVNKKAFVTKGVAGALEVEASVAKEAKISEIMKRDNLPKGAAMEKAVVESPELFK
jgi:hypothetical protein